MEDYVDPEEADALGYFIHQCCKVSEVPGNYNEAITSAEAHKWQTAMDEIEALKENDTYELSVLPKNKSAIGERWVYVVKEAQNGKEKLKALYVAKGYSQVKDVDYTEAFSPTARMTYVRMLMQLSIDNSFLVHCMDFKSAYLNAKIECEIYVNQPEGYVEKNKHGDELVWKLNKSLYGLKQSGRNWNNVLHNFLIVINLSNH